MRSLKTPCLCEGRERASPAPFHRGCDVIAVCNQKDRVGPRCPRPEPHILVSHGQLPLLQRDVTPVRGTLKCPSQQARQSKG